jgi:hypothetical protein
LLVAIKVKSLGEPAMLGAGRSIICKVQRISELFTRYSHHCPPRPASGLRLETGPNPDKKKSELYFLSPVKKFLTENRKRNPEK